MVRKPAQKRIDREEASERMINAAIDLLSTAEIAEITVDRITETAGLASGHVLVHRYFGSRAELMAAVAHRLAEGCVRAINDSVDSAANPSGDTVVGALIAIARGVEMIRKRALVLAELQTVAADPAPHAVDYQEIAAAVRQRLAAVVSNERILRPLSLKVLALIQMEATQRAWTGTSETDRADIRQLIMGEIALADRVAAELGW